jgi:hypothetical protein
MKIEFENKPTPELIKNYCKKIEKFLSAHKLSFIIELWDSPLRIESYCNNEHTSTTYCWIKKCEVSNRNIGNLVVRLLRQGIKDGVDDYDIWNEAGYIQDQIYKHFKLDPGNPVDNDHYWNLWKLYPKE